MPDAMRDSIINLDFYSSKKLTIPTVRKLTTVNALLTDTLVSGQLYLRTPFQIPVFTSQSNSVFAHSRKRTLSRKRTRTLLKMKIGFFFCLRSLVS